MRKPRTNEAQPHIFGAITNVSTTYRKIIARLAAWLSGDLTPRDVAVASAVTGCGAVLDKTGLRFYNWQLLGLAVII
ncbi:MAG: hypothetical protein OSB34_01770 [Planktomarina sp.]|jgi:hypothetical protein|nr:hypothetical protein [Planktomarina sp.]